MSAVPRATQQPSPVLRPPAPPAADSTPSPQDLEGAAELGRAMARAVILEAITLSKLVQDEIARWHRVGAELPTEIMLPLANKYVPICDWAARRVAQAESDVTLLWPDCPARDRQPLTEARLKLQALAAFPPERIEAAIQQIK